ncbi:MAG: type II toxin-antitoxin system VapC family toxin [Acidobacteria bacterium]|jgi:predicted nucleic acid-binding protein|nr:type II toxin-antitoxin system VapC family toxin [Acidobacteriota bacterium]MBA4183213.1 type II toxin-antitoxin system VapC family toxin [Acidobacteriota bacterium]
MNFLLDTCAISEPKQKRPSAKVLEWLDAQDESKLYLSVLSLGEIRKEIIRLESSRKRAELEKWLEQLRMRFSRRILPLSEKTFLVWGKMYGEFERKGIVRPAFDSLLEATALEHDMIFVTQNVKNFHDSQITILNPWAD